tara:strand:+ start:340 stop:828 length:489 start_codon:yes stop_codon:yes gene_type:complete
MSDFNYTEYLKNNPLLKKEVKGSLITESQDTSESYSSKMKVSELKSKIKENIMSLLQEEDTMGLEDELMADLDESLYEAKEDDDDEEEVEVDMDVDMESEEDLEGGEAESSKPSAGLTQNEQDIQNALKVAYDNAISLGDEKLADQIGNTITMFTRTRVVNR